MDHLDFVYLTYATQKPASNEKFCHNLNRNTVSFSQDMTADQERKAQSIVADNDQSIFKDSTCHNRI